MSKIYTRKFNTKIKLIKDTVILYITICKSNFIVTITDIKSNVLNWFSSGSLRFRGFRKSTPLAAEEITKKIIEQIKFFNSKNIILKIKGFGPSKLGLLKYLIETDLNFIKIEDISNYAFNGSKPQKRRKI